MSTSPHVLILVSLFSVCQLMLFYKYDNFKVAICFLLEKKLKKVALLVTDPTH